MFNRIRFLTITLAVCGVGSASAYAQMASLERDLASHGITDLSERSLIASLSDKDPHVRTVAAMKLAEDHYDDAAPAIKSALSREQDVNAQIGLSEALWGLHDKDGISHLHAMCTDSSLSINTLNFVIDALRNTQSPAGECAETFFAAMARAKEPEISPWLRVGFRSSTATPRRSRHAAS